MGVSYRVSRNVRATGDLGIIMMIVAAFGALFKGMFWMIWWTVRVSWRICVWTFRGCAWVYRAAADAMGRHRAGHAAPEAPPAA